MIIFNLKCKSCNHFFEGWFNSSEEFNSQIKKKLILCPACNSGLINKSLILSRGENMKRYFLIITLYRLV